MDENFLCHSARARQLLSEMERHKKPYVFDIFASADVVRKLGVDFLVRLGIRMIWIGVESNKNIYRKTKGIDLHELIRELQSEGIIVIASTILFLDHHDRQSIMEDMDWAIGLGSDYMQFMQYTPYPSTALYERLKSEGRLRKVPYRKQHGQDELCFVHPHFADPHDHREYLRMAFRKKYERDGPGVLNMALTTVRGYRKAKKDLIERQEKGLSWNPETLRYEATRIWIGKLMGRGDILRQPPLNRVEYPEA
jgi:radical SAM superfamily enzyme YgiQ (UPF0313 family)